MMVIANSDGYHNNDDDDGDDDNFGNWFCSEP